MSRVLITGAEGFTGRYLAAELAAQGHEVHGLVMRAPDDRPAQASTALAATPLAATHVCDLLDAEQLSAVVADVQPDKVAHLAAIAFVGHGDVEAFYRVNIVGTRHLLAALAGAAVAPSAVLLASSANIYGNAAEGVIDESVQPAPANDYAVSKLAMEYMAKTWADRLPLTLVRPFNYTGVGQSEDFLLPKIVAHFRRRAAVIELGNLDVERDFADVRTVAQVYRRLLEGNTAHQTLNVCSGRGHTLRGVLDLVGDLAGYRPEIRVNPAFVRANEVRRLLGSKAALERCIGAVEGPSLKDTLPWILAA